MAKFSVITVITHPGIVINSVLSWTSAWQEWYDYDGWTGKEWRVEITSARKDWACDSRDCHGYGVHFLLLTKVSAPQAEGAALRKPPEAPAPLCRCCAEQPLPWCAEAGTRRQRQSSVRWWQEQAGAFPPCWTFNPKQGQKSKQVF